MKKIFTLLPALLLAFSLSAQINITSYSGTVAGTQDTFKSIAITSLISINVAPAVNNNWDMTSLKYNTGLLVTSHLSIPSGITAFPSAQYIDLGSYPITSGVSYNTNGMMQVSSAGVMRLGEHLDQQTISLGSLTGSSTDTLGFPMQDIAYSSPAEILHFPLTFKTAWSSSSHFITNFKTTVSPLLFGAPTQRRTILTMRDSVVGWGKMKVNDASGNPSGYIDVLQVRTTESSMDSIYFYGIPADSATLAMFGLSQGQITSLYSVNFYRNGEIAPLLSVIYNDSNYITPSSGEVHVQRLKSAGVGNVIASSDINVYPNPVTNHSITIDIPQNAAGIWGYELTNISGQRLSKGVLPNGQSHIQVSLPSSITPGVYYLHLTNDGDQTIIKSLTITK